ncbi:MAG: acyltransferase [Chloroflexi bacterium]|nr:acyltransferase [Chloroflexota bacterium]
MVKRLLYLNGLAILGAVLYHATAQGFVAMFWWSDRYRAVSAPNFDQMGSAAYYGLRLIEQGIIFAIPAFVFVSGFFIAAATGRSQRTVSWQVIWARLRKLLIPFLIWSLLIVALDYLQGKRLPVDRLLVALVTGQVEGPYYFVPMLAQLLLMAPFLVPAARARGKTTLAAAALAQVVFLLMRYLLILGIDIPALRPLALLTRSFLFTSQVFWFVFGLTAGLHLGEFKAFIRRWRIFLLILACAAFVAGFVEWELLLRRSGEVWLSPTETLIDQVFAFGAILSYLAYEHTALPLEGWLSALGVRSYGIYLIHSPALEYTARIVYHVAPGLLGVQILFMPLLVAAGLAAPLALMALVNRSPARRRYEALFG